MSFNPMGDNSRWAGILAGRIQPTPEEARILAMLRQLGGDIVGPTAPAGQGPPTSLPYVDQTGQNMQQSGAALLGGMQGLGQNTAAGAMAGPNVVGRGISDYVDRVNAAGQRGYDQAVGIPNAPYMNASYGGTSGMQAEGPAPMSAAAYQQAPAANPTTNAANPAAAANPEQAYAQAYQQAGGGTTSSGFAGGSSGGSYPDESERGSARMRATSTDSGGGSTSSGFPATTRQPGDGQSSGGMSAKGYPDESGRGLDSSMLRNPDYSLSPSAQPGAGTGGALDYNRVISQQYEKQPDKWVEDLFANRGVTQSRSNYASGWANEWADKMPLLLDFYVMAQGGDPYSPEARARAQQSFGPEVINGRVHPSMIIQQALKQAQANPVVMAALVEMGPDAVLGLRALQSGQSRRVSSAYNTVLQRKLGEERRARVAAGQRGVADDNEAAIRIAMGGI
jgi:hypothetical protein